MVGYSQLFSMFLLQLFTASSEPLTGKEVIPLFEIPNIETRRLSSNSPVDVNAELAKNTEGRVTLLTVNFSGIGLKNQDVSQWQNKFLQEFGQESDAYNLYHIKYMDGFEYYFAPSMFTRMNQDSVPEQAREKAFVAFEPYHYNITVRSLCTVLICFLFMNCYFC